MTTESDRPPELPPEAFRKQDGSDNRTFFAPARLVTHSDDAATNALTASYRATCLREVWSSTSDVELGKPSAAGGGLRRSDRAGHERRGAQPQPAAQP